MHEVSVRTGKIAEILLLDSSGNLWRSLALQTQVTT
jgi:hypothetical protein